MSRRLPLRPLAGACPAVEQRVRECWMNGSVSRSGSESAIGTTTERYYAARQWVKKWTACEYGGCGARSRRGALEHAGAGSTRVIQAHRPPPARRRGSARPKSR
jgi:hypothetical protein